MRDQYRPDGPERQAEHGRDGHDQDQLTADGRPGPEVDQIPRIADDAPLLLRKQGHDERDRAVALEDPVRGPMRDEESPGEDTEAEPGRLERMADGAACVRQVRSQRSSATSASCFKPVSLPASVRRTFPRPRPIEPDRPQSARRSRGGPRGARRARGNGRRCRPRAAPLVAEALRRLGASRRPR